MDNGNDGEKGAGEVRNTERSEPVQERAATSTRST
jgi:hypothetical protein